MIDLTDVLQSESKFRYMLLDRLRQDCEYYLGYGGRCAKHLWAGNEEDHITAMKVIWNSFPDSMKPEWLPYSKIEEYEKKMISPEKASLDHQIQSASARGSNSVSSGEGKEKEPEQVC